MVGDSTPLMSWVLPFQVDSPRLLEPRLMRDWLPWMVPFARFGGSQSPVDFPIGNHEHHVPMSFSLKLSNSLCQGIRLMDTVRFELTAVGLEVQRSTT